MTKNEERSKRRTTMRHRLHKPVDPYLRHNSRVVFHMDFMEMQMAQGASAQRELIDTLNGIELQLGNIAESMLEDSQVTMAMPLKGNLDR